MLYPARCKKITVDRNKVLKKSTVPFFLGGHPGIMSMTYCNLVSVDCFLHFYRFLGSLLHKCERQT